ncbi:MAG: dihydroorotate dehydrogenase electron transfer subunit [Spirochaetaceae bacterium]|jgi:dihydroorotate dehydrogenase electron transfer subunit|nr:dihydroorotate dehydrogenase electron transfer subunit [Spirochaetaceae bacterium]
MAQLIKNPKRIAKDHISLFIEMDGTEPLPGQFVNIKIGSDSDPLIRRPFSVYNYENNLYELVVRIVGRGTEIISEMKPGPIDILGPLGKGFTIIESGHALLVGGGVGNAPLYFLARALKEKGVAVTCIYGAASKEFIYKLDDFEKICDTVHVTTDDGSQGVKGFSTDLMKDLVAETKFDMIYTCGPEVMMAGVTKISGDISLEVSMENYFGCGVGICSGCVFDTPDGYKRACVDGPVYNGKEVIWS